MRSLFFRIFLWFWLALALVNAGFFLSLVLTRPEPPRPRWNHPPGRSPIDIYAPTAAEIYERQGKDALVAYLNRLEEATGMRTVLFDKQGAEVSGRTVFANAPTLAARARRQGPPEFTDSGGVRLEALRTRTLEGGEYIMVAERPLSEDRPRWFFLRTQAPRFLISILIGGLLCFWLARHLTNPVGQLRAATQQLAAGNLDARVGAEITARGGELAQLGLDFNRMAERIQAMLVAQRRLLGDISHELRSPLTRLSLALELARQRVGDGGAATAAAHDRIELEAASLNEMISQLLTLTKMESGAESLEKTQVELSSLVKEVVDDADFEARGRGREVRLISVENCQVRGTFDLLRSAVENVIRNAVRYTAEGTAVEVSLTCDGVIDDRRYAAIKVRDYGPGVRPELREEIFRPFYRVADDRDRESGGTGLGLAITSRVIQSHQGLVRANNAPGGGLAVDIFLPLEE